MFKNPPAPLRGEMTLLDLESEPCESRALLSDTLSASMYVRQPVLKDELANCRPSGVRGRLKEQMRPTDRRDRNMARRDGDESIDAGISHQPVFSTP